MSLDTRPPSASPGCADLGIDLAELRQSLAMNVGLPPRHYHDPAIYGLELARIFEGRWQYFAPVALLAEPGDVVTGMVGRTPVAVTRDHAGKLHGLVNFCRHRGFPVAEGIEKGCKRLYCRYHSWTYRLDGSLVRAPDSDQDPGFDPAEHGLRKVSVGVWGPAVFVNTDPHAPPFEEAMPELAEIAEMIGFDAREDSYVLHDTYTKAQDANWKLWTDNGVECYHCGPVHGETFGRAFSTDQEGGGHSKVVNIGSVISNMIKPKKSTAPVTDELQAREYRSILLFPGAHFAQQDEVMVLGRMVPTGPGSCTYTAHYFRHKDVEPHRASAWVELYNRTFDEDAAVVELQQVNLRGPNAVPFRYIPAREEAAIITNRMIAEAIAD